jgi:hypothetical protein
MIDTTWLDVQALSQDVMLCLHDGDDYASHVALRHMHDLPLSAHAVYVAVPPSLRTHKAFTPWLRDGITVAKTKITDQRTSERKQEFSTILKFESKLRHVHSSGVAKQHQASFKIRVGGQAVNALFDTGATCCCMHKNLVHQLGLKIRDTDLPPITGMGGPTIVVGTVDALVKVGRSNESQTFLVLTTPISGYI